MHKKVLAANTKRSRCFFYKSLTHHLSTACFSHFRSSFFFELIVEHFSTCTLWYGAIKIYGTYFLQNHFHHTCARLCSFRYRFMKTVVFASASVFYVRIRKINIRVIHINSGSTPPSTFQNTYFKNFSLLLDWVTGRVLRMRFHVYSYPWHNAQ